jgi:hypothetical protein
MPRSRLLGEMTALATAHQGVAGGRALSRRPFVEFRGLILRSVEIEFQAHTQNGGTLDGGGREDEALAPTREANAEVEPDLELLHETGPQRRVRWQPIQKVPQCQLRRARYVIALHLVKPCARVK